MVCANQETWGSWSGESSLMSPLNFEKNMMVVYTPSSGALFRSGVRVEHLQNEMYWLNNN